VRCRLKLSEEDRSPETTALLQAGRSLVGNQARHREVIIEEDGVCSSCGKSDYVMYLEL